MIARKGGKISDFLYSIAYIYTRSYKNLNYDMSTNGEFLLLDRLAKSEIKTIFDVGANKGDYAEACLTRFPTAMIHAFEIVPATFSKLQTHIGRKERVVLNAFGLSDEERTLEINYNSEHDGSSSIIEGRAIHQETWSKVEGKVKRGDDYCTSNNVKHIDLLKIDVEGAEHLVLAGFKRMFEQGSISCVQFEFGLVNIYSKFLLKDFWEFLEDVGFVVGPIMPNGVEFKSYDPRDEDFQGPPNFFAVHRKQTAIVSLVSRPNRRATSIAREPS